MSAMRGPPQLRVPSGSKADLRDLALSGILELEEFAPREAERTGQEVRRHALHPGVAVTHRRVVTLARPRDRPLGVGEGLLERQEALVRLQIGVALCDGVETAERLRQQTLRLRRLSRRRGAHRPAPQLRHLLEDASLVTG